MFDLHMHSSHSDGSLSPSELVAQCAQVGLQTIALTDHDTVAGLDDAAAAAARHNIRFINGIELSTTYGGKDLHLLGYNFDPHNAALCAALALARTRRMTRAQAIVDRLSALGISLDWDRITAQSHSVLARPHIASAMVEAGYVTSVQEAFDTYLAEGKEAFLPSGKLPTPEAIALLRTAGGYAFVAHPILPNKVLDLQTILPPFRKAGLTGLEAYYTGYSADHIAGLLQSAGAFELMVSGGSDFHGISKPTIRLGEIQLPPEILSQPAFAASPAMATG